MTAQELCRILKVSKMSYWAAKKGLIPHLSNGRSRPVSSKGRYRWKNKRGGGMKPSLFIGCSKEGLEDSERSTSSA